jgi:hypothetical protein
MMGCNRASHREPLMPNINVQDAIKKARSYVGEIFKEEPITDIGLEEVEHDLDTWKITIGFNRMWKASTRSAITLMTEPTAQRFYKVVTISDSDGTLVSIKNRDISH